MAVKFDSSGSAKAKLSPSVSQYKPPVRAAAAPPAQAAYVPPPAPPPDPYLEGDLGSANRNVALSMQNINYQRGQLGSTFGLGSGAGGVFDDPSNPFSRAAALHTAYTQSQARNTNSYAARGQLYSGSLQNAQNEAATQNNRGRDALVREFLAAQQGLQMKELEANNLFQDQTSRARADAIARALAYRGGT